MNHREPQSDTAAQKLPPRSIGNEQFERLLDTEEAAKLLKMHPRTLRAKARDGTVPAIQVGKRWRFRASALDQWLGKLAS